jgi:hypothetical protein
MKFLCGQQKCISFWLYRKDSAKGFFEMLLNMHGAMEYEGFQRFIKRHTMKEEVSLGLSLLQS